MPQKQDLIARLTTLKATVRGYQFRDFDSIPDADYPAAMYGHYLANTAARLIDEALETLGHDDTPQWPGLVLVTRITINGLGQVEPERTRVNPDSPEALRIAASFISIVEVVVAGIERGLPTIDRATASEVCRPSTALPRSRVLWPR